MQLKCSMCDVYIPQNIWNHRRRKKKKIHVPQQNKNKLRMAWPPASFKRENYYCTFWVSADIRATFMRSGFSRGETIADSCQMKVISLLGRQHMWSVLPSWLWVWEAALEILPKDVLSFLPFLKQWRKAHIYFSTRMSYIPHSLVVSAGGNARI